MAGEQSKPGAGGSDQLTGLKTRLDEMHSLFKQWEAARSTASRARLGVFIVILAVVLIYGYLLLSTILKVREPQYMEDLLAATTSAATLMLEQARPQVQSAFMRLRPVYESEVKKQFAEHKDEMYKEIVSEAEKLGEELSEKAEGRFTSWLDQTAAKQKDAVRAAFPAIKTDADLDKVITNLNVALNSAAYEVLNKRVSTAQDQLLEVADLVYEFLPADRREEFAGRMSRLWDVLLLDELGGRKHIENN